MMGKDTSRAAKHHTNLDPLSVSCHALSSTLAWCKRLREHKGTMWTQFIWLTGCMPERRHHAATLKMKTLQSARQPAMQRLLHKWGFPKIRVPQNGWFIMENLIKMDDLGGKPTIFGNIQMFPESVHHRLSDCQMPPGCRMLATQTCSSSRILALPTNGVENSCTREMRSSLVTQVEGCMKFGSPRGQDDVSHDLD